MKYYSTRKNSEEVSFKDAVIRGLAPDGGLYFPERIDKLPEGLIGSGASIEELGYEVTGFSTYDPNVHQECHIPFNITSIKGNIAITENSPAKNVNKLFIRFLLKLCLKIRLLFMFYIKYLLWPLILKTKSSDNPLCKNIDD